MRTIILVAAVWLLSLVTTAQAQVDTPAAAQALGQARPAVIAQPDGLIICEAEEFQVAAGGWQARRWGQNYYSSTFANTFLSRKAFLGAPQQGERAVAKIRVRVPAAGRYLALVRYEAAYRFETQFRLIITQQGQPVLDRLYGARDNLKIWAFSTKLKQEVAWPWGAVENMVWEGHDAFVDLEPGLATMTLIADKQPTPAARRNVDLVMLTTEIEQVKARIEKESYLPLDGMLTQSGDVWLRVTNRGESRLTFQGGRTYGGGNWQQHSPYWVHLRTWQAPSVTVQPGKTSDWTEVGGTMDTLCDGQWFWTGDGKYQAEFGLKNAAGEIESLATFTGEGRLDLAADADTRYSRRLRTQEQVLYDLLAELKDVPPHGKKPAQTTIYASTFAALGSARHAAAVAHFKEIFSLSDTRPDAPGGRGYIDVRSVPTPKLAEYCAKLGADAANVAVVSLGDEISLPLPQNADQQPGFHDWLRAQQLRPADIDPRAGNDWSQIEYNPDANSKSDHPGRFYWSRRYLHHYGIQAVKQRTDILRRHLPKAAIGANYSPHHPAEHMFLGEVFKWVTVFRQEGMTLPWSEDYIWQVPIGTPQMNAINLDLFRAGLRGKETRQIQYYVMPHMPGNTPRAWKRLFYCALAHGATIFNLFEFRPVHVAYTENHVDEPAMYKMVQRSFGELGMFEDILHAGRIRPARAALWFGETGDIWGDSQGSFAAAKRSLYTAIRHQQVPLDFVVEQDALDGTLDQYQVLFLADAHVSRAAGERIADWVAGGGALVATAGAGMFDELNRPHKLLRDLLGVEQLALDVPEGAQIQFIKQDLPFAPAIDRVRSDDAAARLQFPIFAARSRVRALSSDTQVVARFQDGSPAVTLRRRANGSAVYCGFLPGLTYFKPAIPLRPVDRAGRDDAMCHFLPTQFDSQLAELIRWSLGTNLAAGASSRRSIARPVVCSQRLVESMLIESEHGAVIPLINWRNQPARGLRVSIHADVPSQEVRLASGAPVEVKREADRLVVTLDLPIADALILR